MQKLGLGFLVTGVLGQLSELLWTYTSTEPTCQNNANNSHAQRKVTEFEQSLDDTANKVATELDRKTSGGLALLAENESPIPGSTEADAVQFLIEPGDDPVPALSSLPTRAHKWIIIFSGLVAFTGLLLAAYARKKSTDPQWHAFRAMPGSLVTLSRPCLTCGGLIPHVAKDSSATPASGLWVIEIALNAPSRHRVTKAIKQMELRVARKENNFVVVGPYKQKQDAARVVKDLSEHHGVRGWMMEGV